MSAGGIRHGAQPLAVLHVSAVQVIWPHQALQAAVLTQIHQGELSLSVHPRVFHAPVHDQTHETYLLKRPLTTNPKWTKRYDECVRSARHVMTCSTSPTPQKARVAAHPPLGQQLAQLHLRSLETPTDAQATNPKPLDMQVLKEYGHQRSPHSRSAYLSPIDRRRTGATLTRARPYECYALREKAKHI